MKRTIKAALGAAPLLVLAHMASAGEPVQLSEQQMDEVTAAGSAIGVATAAAIGGFAFTQTFAFAEVAVVSVAAFEATTIANVRSTSAAESLSDTSGP